MTGYILYIGIGSQMLEFPLYAVEDTRVSLSLLRFGIAGNINLAVWDNSWLFEDNKDFTMLVRDAQSNSMAEVAEVTIKDNKHILFKSKMDDTRFTVFCVETNKDFINYMKYLLPENGEITFGTAANCTVQLSNNALSPQHMQLRIRNGEVSVFDFGTKFGTFVNGERVAQNAEVKLSSGDTISLYGTKVVYMGYVIAINRPSRTRANLTLLTALNTMTAQDVVLEDDLFSRSPRILQPYDTEEIKLEAPPSPKKEDDTPFIFTIGPALTMPIPMMTSMMLNATLNSRGISGSIPMVVSMLLMATMSVVWSIARTKWRKKKDAADEVFRKGQYTRYIEQNKQFLMEKADFNKAILAYNYLPTQELVLSITGHRERIWNRNVHHEDFLAVRIGVGKCENLNKVTAPETRFSLENDELMELPHALAEEYKYLSEVPTVVNLQDSKNRIIGIVGQPAHVHLVTRDILLQLSALHSYMDVKICVLYREDEIDTYSWVRWLPHVFTSDKRMRLVGDSKSTQEHVLQFLSGELNNRKTQFPEGIDYEKIPTDLCRYVVVVTSDEILESSQLVTFLTSDKYYGVNFILAYSTLNGIPNECNALIEANEDFQGYYCLNEARDETANTLFDTFPEALPEWYARKISGLAIKEVAIGEIPESIDYLSLLKIGKLEQWDLLRKYKENRAYNSINALLGIGSGGKEICLDLHEKKHGPHGLVAGTTGSGKSETLQTAILSWAMNYSPEEVAFVLIDYKGGGMANLFEGVPHVAGTITNISNEVGSADDEDEGENESLDDSQTRRALTAIKAEIKYRQGLFTAAKVNHIDAYMKMYRKGQVKEPLPHLILISDEFAELKKEQPEFIRELVSAARVGRSLGIHLILATQKPSNSVDDEIWANSRFKICLRVQDQADSSSMLKRPEAAFITKTGRGLFQLGNNEIFEEFQSGWSGADYIPKDKIEHIEDSICTMIDMDGLDTPIEVERKARADNQMTQLEACVKYIRRIALETGEIKQARQLWPPQLRRHMYLDVQLPKLHVAWERGVMACVGLIDDPEKQSQHPAVLDFLKVNNVLVTGAPGIGKSTLLQTLLYSLITHYTPEQVNYYILDFSSRALRYFDKVKWCGGYILPDDDKEKITRLYQLLNMIIVERKELFETANVGTMAEYVKKNTLPVICVCIDGYENYIEENENTLDTLTALLREGPKYGIQFICSLSKPSGMRMKQRQLILNAVGLFMPDKADFRDIYNLTAEFMPAHYKGRGLYMVGKKLLEYQTFLPLSGETESDRSEALAKNVAEYSKKFEAIRGARRIPVIPKDETYAQLVEQAYVDNTKLPIGYDMTTIAYEYVDLRTTYCYNIGDATNDGKGVTVAFTNFMYALNKFNYDIRLIKCNRKVKLSLRSFDKSHIYSSWKEVYAVVEELEQLGLKRFKERNTLLTANPDFNYAEYVLERNEAVFVMVDNWADLLILLSSENQALSAYERSLNEAATIDRLYELIIHSQDLGIYFIGGVITAHTGLEHRRDKIFKEVLSSGQGLHFGGMLSDALIFTYTGSLAQGNKQMPENNPVSKVGLAMQTYHMPVVLE